DLLPEGPARVRAAATARSVAAMLVSGPPNVESYRAALAPNIEFVDKRALGFPSGPGAEEYVDLLCTLFEVADNLTMRVDDVLALRADALLMRWTNFGTGRTGGGAFERHFLMLFAFGNEGLLTRNELFDADRDDEALAHLDALTAEPAAARFAAAPSRVAEKPG